MMRSYHMSKPLEILQIGNASFNTDGWGLWKIIIGKSDVFAGFAGLFGLLPDFIGLVCN